MKENNSLLELICPVRNRSIRPSITGRYLVREQQQEFDGEGARLPGEIRASDGNTDNVKITDKGNDTPP